ncbi:MAG: hypothetical protein WCT04_18790, partial [Planctomycetota bacterium]
MREKSVLQQIPGLNLRAQSQFAKPWIPLCLILIFRAALALGAEAPAPLLDDVAVRLEPCAPFPYVEPDAKGKVSFLFTSKADHELQLTWKVQI